MSTILIVDDEPAVRELLMGMLASEGHQPLAAANGTEALHLARERHPDLIVTDVIMPAMDGYELVRKLRSEPGIADIPVILHTAIFHQQEAKELARSCGVDHVLIKPANRSTILRTLKAALAGKPIAPSVPAPDFEREHRRLLTDELALEVNRLKMANARLQQEIKKRMRAEKMLKESRRRLQTLSRQLLQAQESERRHIARELHDEIGQALTVIKINLQSLTRSSSALTPRLEESIGIVERTLEQVRNLSLDLRPSILDDLGLVAAVRWYLDRQAQRAGFVVQLITEPLPDALAPELDTACFRVIQEAVTNIVRHARATQVRVTLTRVDDELHLQVHDNGVGFDVAAARTRAARGASLGLLGMRERVMLLGGRLEVLSGPSRGTEVQARFPLDLTQSSGNTGTS
jgi:signal transduction histidine kinase